MKLSNKIYLGLVLQCGFSGAVFPAGAQQSAAADAGFADGVVGTVGQRKITRRDVAVTCAAFDPKILGAALWARYPQMEGDMTLTMDALCRNAFEAGTAPFENTMSYLLVANALEEAAARRGLVVTPEGVEAQTRRDLEPRRKMQHLADSSVEELARALGDNPFLLRRTARETLLKQSLMLADLNDRLGHPLGIEDYYSIHAIFTRVNDGQGALDAQATLEKIRRQRADILAQKRTFESMAKEESQDASRARGGDFGPLTRKLLKNEVDAALAQLKPGEITEPIAIFGGYAIFRLDKRGAELTDAERKTALATYMKSDKRKQEAIAKAVRDIPWTTTIGKTPEWLKRSDESDNAALDPKPNQTASGAK